MQKVARKGRPTDRKTPSVRRQLCKDCPEATVHSTGSQLWISCRYQKGWRSINSQCNLSEQKNPSVLDSKVKPIKTPEIQGLYPVKDSCQSFWTLKAICELSKFREKPSQKQLETVIFHMTKTKEMKNLDRTKVRKM